MNALLRAFLLCRKVSPALGGATAHLRVHGVRRAALSTNAAVGHSFESCVDASLDERVLVLLADCRAPRPNLEQR